MRGPTSRRFGAALAAIASLAIAAPAVVAQNAPPEAEPPESRTVDMTQLRGVFGEHISDPNGEDAGRMWDILIDHDGKPRAVVIDYGGVLGVGQRKVAVDWQALHFVPEDAKTPIHLALTRQQLGELPEFKYGTATAVIGDGH
jgi:hypothetical protein